MRSGPCSYSRGSCVKRGEMYDVVIIGAGVIGCGIARELSRYDLSILILEKEGDVADGTTKANSAIVHAGFDAYHKTVNGQMNARGNPMYDRLASELNFPFQRIGSLVLAFSEEELGSLRELVDNAKVLKIPGVEMLAPETVHAKHANLSQEIRGALWAPTGGICGPWEFAIALAENAVENGVELALNTKVTGIQKADKGFFIGTADGQKIESRVVVNAAGVYADTIHNMVAEPFFEIHAKRGQYFLLDKAAGGIVDTVIFQAPTKAGKGVLVSPTVHGNIIVGPDAEYVEDREDLRTTGPQLDFVRQAARQSVPNIPFGLNITTFAGLRAESSTRDFIIGPAEDVPNFINAAGMKSPGLSAAPAVAEEVAKHVAVALGGDLKERKNFDPHRRPAAHFAEASPEKQAELIASDSRFARIVCRCEYVTEAEVVDAIHRKVGALSVDGVKRRARPGGGRCQGGFCSPRVMEILARELEIDMGEVVKDGPGSYILTGRTKAVEGGE